jgi:hypothetical protein
MKPTTTLSRFTEPRRATRLIGLTAENLMHRPTCTRERVGAAGEICRPAQILPPKMKIRILAE